jgi:hypothetical protein
VLLLRVPLAVVGMSTAWPAPDGGWLDIDDLGDVMTDDEIRALGFEPTARGWRRTWPENQPPAETDQAELIEGLREALRKRRYA